MLRLRRAPRRRRRSRTSTSTSRAGEVVALYGQDRVGHRGGRRGRLRGAQAVVRADSRSTASRSHVSGPADADRRGRRLLPATVSATARSWSARSPRTCAPPSGVVSRGSASSRSAPRPAPTGAGTTAAASARATTRSSRSARCRAATSRRCCSAAGSSATSRVLVLVEPTRGVDVGARAGDLSVDPGARRTGLAVLVSTSDYEEVVQVADRAVVMARGRESWRTTRGRRGHGRASSLGGRRGTHEHRGRTESVTAEPSAPPVDAVRRRRPSLPKVTALVVFLIAESIFFSIRRPYFLTWDNLLNILTAIAVIGIVAAPGTLLIVAGQFDLSVASITAFTGVAMATAAQSHSLAVGIMVAVAVGVGVGVVNGFLVTVVGVNALITTLGTLAVFRGLLERDRQRARRSPSTASPPSGRRARSGHPGAGDRPDRRVPDLLVPRCATRSTAARCTRSGRTPRRPAWSASAPGSIFIGFVLSGAACALSGLILTSQLGVRVGPPRHRRWSCR